MVRAIVFAGLTCLFSVPAQAGLVINYTGPAQYQAAFDNAEAIWESLLPGYQNGIVTARTSGSSLNVGDTLSDLLISAVIEPIDGPGLVLGSAGPDELIRDQLGFILATDGSMRFDVADVADLVTNGVFESVILHEMAGSILTSGPLKGPI